MQWKRWTTALIALPLLILLILKGGALLFFLSIWIVATITLWEYFRIVHSGHAPDIPMYYSLLAYAAGAGIMLTVQGHGLEAAAGVLVLHLIGTAIMSISRFKVSQDAPLVVLKQVFGVIYIPFFLSFLVLIYDGGSADGIHWIFLLMLVVATGDTGAYYVGSYWGRHKLCPSVSPNKTIEGAIGGMAASLLFSTGYKFLFLPALSLPGCLIFALVVGGVGQAGDLFESEFKRAAGVKDSGGLLPGHGGFLDRLDALLFAAPTAYLFKEYLLS